MRIYTFSYIIESWGNLYNYAVVAKSKKRAVEIMEKHVKKGWKDADDVKKHINEIRELAYGKNKRFPDLRVYSYMMNKEKVISSF